jgi:uncharacterized membrane protein
MYNLLASAVIFVLLHRAISGSLVRGLLVRRMGEQAYGRSFQILSIAGLVWLGMAYAGTDHAAFLAPLWNTPSLVRQLQLIIQPVALLLIVTGLTTPNPATFRQEAVADQPDIVRGVLRVTRHPFLWGVALFAAGHLLASPSPRNLVLFGTLLAVALTGTVSIDAKRHRALGPKWTAFAARTSNIPIAAILTGRQPLRLGELGWKSFIAVAAISAVLTLTHSFLFGVSAAP